MSRENPLGVSRSGSVSGARSNGRVRRAFRNALAVWFALFLGASQAFALQPDEILDDPELERRARSISAQLRCMVCQNQSIDDSEAELARDLRNIVRQRLQSGQTDQQILDFAVERYGEFILLKPPAKGRNLILWATPGLALLFGLALMLARRNQLETKPLTSKEKERIAKILGSED